MNTAKDVLRIAAAELGVREAPAGSNNVKFNTWYYGRAVSGDAYPWCMAFVQWVMDRAGVKVPVRTASCGALMRAAKAAGQWITGGYLPGDVLIYDFPGGAATDHTGICEAFDGRKVTAIEGNTSVNNASNGGEVRRMKRDAALVVGAWRPDYDLEQEDDGVKRYKTINDVPGWYRGAVQKYIDGGGIDPKGVDGKGTIDLSEDMCRMMTANEKMGLLG